MVLYDPPLFGRVLGFACDDLTGRLAGVRPRDVPGRAVVGVRDAEQNELEHELEAST